MFLIHVLIFAGSDLGAAIPCPSLHNCTDNCQLGRKLDHRRCPECNNCVTNGTVEGDILIDGRLKKIV